MSFFLKAIGRSSSAVEVTSRSVAKDRLSVILASQRGSELLEGVDMEKLQKDVLEVVQVSVWLRTFLSIATFDCPAYQSASSLALAIQKHINIAQNRPVNFNVNSEGDVSLFEMQVELMARKNAR